MENPNDNKERTLQRKVEKFLQRDERVIDDNITVTVRGTNVMLDGKVRSHNALRAAENDAYTVMGVTAVDNNLQVELPGDYTEPSDLEIRDNIKSVMVWNSQIDSTDLEITVNRGIAELTGSVYSYHEKMVASDIALSVKGVKEVRNDIIVNTRHDVNDELIGDNVFDALDSDPMVNAEDIDISINNGLVTLSGTVQDYAAANAAHDALLYIPGVRGIVNNINIG